MLWTKPVLGKEIIEDFDEDCEEDDAEIPETSLVAETLPSVSKTLGKEDTPAMAKEDYGNGVDDDQPKKTFCLSFCG